VLDTATKPPRAPGLEAAVTGELQWVASRPVTDLLRYAAESQTVFRHGPITPGGVHPEYRSLPPGFNPRTMALATELLRAHPGTDKEPLVRAALERLRTGGYRYTLEPGTYGQHSADEFWFDRRLGFCEHIASAFVILMRAMDIPARIVTGYQGGELNGIDGFWVVRQSDAHAWTEVWLAGRGWQRVDPTAAVMPGRIGSFQRLRAPEGVFAAAIATVNPTLSASLRAAWEAVNNRWNQWVLNYTQSKQLDLLRNLGFASPSWEDLSYVLLVILVAVALLGAAWAYWDKTQHDPWLRLLGRARRRLRRAGLEVPPSAPPRQIAMLVTARFGPDARGLAEWLLHLEALRYARASDTNLGALRRQFKLIPWPA
jgi:transglutaminase-like putative cysteine protease